MPINLAIGVSNAHVSVAKRSVLNALTADSKEQAVDRTLVQWITDLFGRTNHKKATETLFDMLHAEDSVAFQYKVIELAKLAEFPQEFQRIFELTVEQDRGMSMVNVRFDGLYVARIWFDGEVKLDEGAFQKERGGQQQSYKLQGDNIPPDQLRLRNLRLARSPQTYIEKLEKNSELLINPTIGNEEIDQLSRDLLNLRSNLPLNSEDKDVLTQKTVTRWILTDLANLTEDDIKFHEQFCDLPAADQRLFNGNPQLFLNDPKNQLSSTAKEFLKQFLIRASTRERQELFQDTLLLRFCRNKGLRLS